MACATEGGTDVWTQLDEKHKSHRILSAHFPWQLLPLHWWALFTQAVCLPSFCGSWPTHCGYIMWMITFVFPSPQNSKLEGGALLGIA